MFLFHFNTIAVNHSVATAYHNSIVASAIVAHTKSAIVNAFSVVLINVSYKLFLLFVNTFFYTSNDDIGVDLPPIGLLATLTDNFVITEYVDTKQDLVP